MKSALLLLALFGSTYAQFSDAGKQGIVDAHNSLRSKIAKGEYTAKGTQEPAGSGILKMKWDDEVASAAQAYAENCPDDHSKTSFGENLYWSWSSEEPSGLDVYGTKACASWEKEFQDYGWTSNTFTDAVSDSGIGHATQMAWGTTGLVGCGVKSCGKDSTKEDMYKIAVVCQYKEAGNMKGDPIYKTGDTCTVCPSGTSCESDSGLCA